MADLIGRRPSFNIPLFLAGRFGLAAGGAPNVVTFCSLVACMGFGVGGNVGIYSLPVDGALYLEYIPFALGASVTAIIYQNLGI